MTTNKESPDLTAHEQGLSWAEQLKPKESPDSGAGAVEIACQSLFEHGYVWDERLEIAVETALKLVAQDSGQGEAVAWRRIKELIERFIDGDDWSPSDMARYLADNLYPPKPAQDAAGKGVEEYAALRKNFERESADIDRILLKLGLPPERARTEAGFLHVPRIENHIQETLDALIDASNRAGEMSDKYCNLVATMNAAKPAQVGEKYRAVTIEDAKDMNAWLLENSIDELPSITELFCTLQHIGAVVPAQDGGAAIDSPQTDSKSIGVK